MYELGQKAEALPLMNESNIYGGVGSDEVSELHSSSCEGKASTKVSVPGLCFEEEGRSYARWLSNFIFAMCESITALNKSKTGTNCIIVAACSFLVNPLT